MDNREFDDMLERLSHATFCESGNGGVLHDTVTFGYFMRWGGLTCCLTDKERDMLARVNAELEWRAFKGAPHTAMERRVLEF